MLGLFLNVLPIRVNLRGSRWSDLIRSVDRELREQYAYRHHPLVDVQNQTGLSLSASMFGYLNFHVLGKSDVAAKILSGQVFEETNYHLVVSVEKVENLRRHSFSVRADAKLFDATRRAHIRAYIKNIVAAIAADDAAPIVPARLLGSDERELQLEQWARPRERNSTDTRNDTLLTAFDRVLETSAEAMALEDSRNTVSFKELATCASRLAHVLVSKGVESDEVVAIRLSPGFDLVTAVLAALKVGCSYALIDVRKSPQRQSWMIRNCAAGLVIEDCALPDLPLLSDDIRRVPMRELQSLAAAATPAGSTVSSGSFRHPRSLAALSWGEGSDQALAFSHQSILQCSLDEVSRTLARLKGLDAVSLSLWGSLLSGHTLDLAQLRLPPGEARNGPPDSISRPPDSVLRPLDSVSRQLLDLRKTDDLFVLKNHGLVPIGTEGELCIGGPAIAEQTYGDPASSAARWTPHPFSRVRGERLFNTGLVARFHSDGALELGSRRLEPRRSASLEELEGLLRDHTGVSDIAIERDESFGGPGKIVVYCALAGAEEQLTAKTVARIRSSHQPVCLPSAVISVPAIPRQPNGRVDFAKLPTPYAVAREESFESPLGLCEELLAGIWSELLKCGRVGRNANFFKLGGYSLVGIQLVARIRQTFGVELPLRAVFECADLKSQAQLIQRSQPREALPAIQTVDRSGPLPLSFAQQRLWFLSRMMPPNALYNISLALRLRGKLNETALVQGLTEIVRRHEALRTRFMEVQGQALQIIDAPDERCVVVEEIASEEALRERCVGERAYCFDLSDEPLYRLRLLRTAFDGQWVLLATLHHIIADGWSLGVFFRELAQLYRAGVAGEGAVPEPLSIQYADYAHWQRQLLQGEGLQRQLDYWRSHLADAPASLELPTDRPRPAVQSNRGDSVAFALSSALSDELKALSRKHNATLFMSCSRPSVCCCIADARKMTLPSAPRLRTAPTRRRRG